ncbi:GvpL/GvpF family gas vesicle protein [Streptomyces sp. NPDC051219]|uniref:GvpL/GvpF family gas vesicle protein n=1 Tax=Streptomyces sp. NPDC051219 TaxID=3155283 RepID=UPI00341B3708
MNELRYVYAVTRPFEGVLPDGTCGLDGEPPRLLHHDGLVAVVSPVPAEDFDEVPLRAHLEDLDWLTGTARAHQGVVAALGTVTCPLPLRLATVCHDDSGVRRLLDSGRERFTATLERLDGRVEWGVKVYVDPDPEPRGRPRAPEPPATGRDYLRRRLQERRSREGDWARADALSNRLHGELGRHAEAGKLHRPQNAQLSGAPGTNVLNAAYLVPRESCETFVGHVRRLTPQQPGIRVELTGPWAPYSFADLPGLPAGEAAR